MPTYDYECTACGLRFEHTQKMTDPPVDVCPQCGGSAKRLVASGAAFIMKGSGSSSSDHREGRPTCGRGSPCCGRSAPCDDKRCKS